jgi:hypothetical protein
MLFMLAQTAWAAEQMSAVEAQKAQTDSLNKIQTVTDRLRDNFKSNAALQRYLYQDLYYFMVMRIQEKDAVFPRINNLVKGYNEEYQTISTKYVLELDEEYLQQLKRFINTHCKYNAYKDVGVCSSGRIEEIFGK